MIPQKIKDKLEVLHIQENEINKEINSIDKEIKRLTNQKNKLAKRVSINMRFRNTLLEYKI